MQWPGVIAPGTTYLEPAISFDISATVIAAAGADATATDGVDLLPFVKGDKAGAPHDILFWRSRTMSNNYGARQGDWKYVHSTEGDASPGPKQKPAQDMLFNLATDISEQTNLAAEQPAKLAELKKLYETWSEAVDADCRKLGLEPKFPKPAPPNNALPNKHTLNPSLFLAALLLAPLTVLAHEKPEVANAMGAPKDHRSSTPT